MHVHGCYVDNCICCVCYVYMNLEHHSLLCLFLKHRNEAFVCLPLPAALPVVLLYRTHFYCYSEHGTTPENEELAEHLAAAVAATAAAAGSSGSSGISRGLAPWQQQALLQLRPPGGVASSMQKQQQQQEQQELPDLRQLLGPASERVDRYESSSSSDGGSSSLSQQQAVAPQQLPDAQMITQLVFANCTGGCGDRGEPCLFGSSRACMCCLYHRYICSPRVCRLKLQQPPPCAALTHATATTYLLLLMLLLPP